MKRLVVFLLLSNISIGLCAQNKVQVQTFVGPDKVSFADSVQTYRALVENTPIEPKFAMVPKFAIVGHDGKFYFSIGARLRFVASVDWGNPITNPVSMSLPDLVERNSGSKELFQMSAGTSQIYFNIVGFPHTHNQVGLFVSINLDAGSDNSYRLSAGQIYMRYRDFQCGYATSLYDDRLNNAYSIDDAALGASGTHSNVQINYQRMFGKHFSLGVGVEMPKVSYTRTLPKEDADIIIGNIEQKMWNVFQIIPDIPLYGQCAWGDRGQIRLSSMIRSIRYYNIAEDKNNYVVGWGLKLTGTVKLGPVKLYGMAHGGHAIANYFAGNKNCDIDLVPTPDSDVTGKLVGTYSLGTIIGVEYNFTPRIFSTLKGSYLRNFIPEYHVDATKKFEDNTLRGQNYSINFIWRISSIFNAGIEYNHVRKTYETHKTLFDNRVYAMFMMTF